MNVKNLLISWFILASLVIAVPVYSVAAEVLYVNSTDGNDVNPGAKDKPVRTIAQAAAIINDSNKPGPTTIKIEPGVYCITDMVIFKNSRAYTKDNRFVIEATVLPDEPNWTPDSMPIVLPTVKGEGPDTVKYATALKIEVNHATVQGIKFLGNPRPRTYGYSVFREGDGLEDLVVKQCMFIGDEQAMPYNIPIIAKGQGLVVDHCIFYKCDIPAIFWDAEGGVSKGNAMRYCIVDGADIAAVWTCQTADDFEFHHNIVSRSEYFWMRPPDNKTTYRIRDCIVTDCHVWSGYGIAGKIYGQTGPEVTFNEEKVVKEGTVTLEKALVKPDILSVVRPRGYLHVVPNTLGSELGAGLFTESVRSTKTEEYGYRKETYAYKEVDGQEILADVFLPATDEVRAVVLYIHGGGFMFGSRIGRPEKSLLDKLIEANYVVVSIDYRMAPETKLEEIVKDVTDACIWIRKQGPSLFNVYPDKLGIVGGSAGAFLATACGYTVKPQPQAVVAISGFADFEFAKLSTDRSILKQSDLYNSVGKKILTQGGEDRYKLCFFLMENGLWPWEVLGFEPNSNQERVNALLPVNHINSDYPATLLIHSKNDQYVPLSQAEKLSRTLTAQKIESELFIVPQGHSSEIIQNDPNAVAKIITFLDRQLKGVKKR
jgi:acetyl esterase/lipase